MKLSKKELFFWTLFFLYGLFILATLPYVVDMQIAIGKSLQKDLTQFIIIWIEKPTIFFLAYLFLYKRERRLSRYFGILLSVLLIILAIYFLILKTNYPRSSKAVEFVHFFEYGLLSFLAYLSLKSRIKNFMVYVFGALLVSIFGFIDEGFQWAIPSRTGEFKDALTNIICAVTFQIFLSQVTEPDRGIKSISRYEIKCLLRGVSAFFAAMTIFVFLVNSGFLIFDNEIGYFKSRFTKEDLLSLKKLRERNFKPDETKPDSKSVVIRPNKWEFADFYEEEAKFHIKFRNDLLKWKGYRSAYSENMILEKYFEPTIKLKQNWSDEQKKGYYQLIPDKDKRYYYKSILVENLMTGGVKVMVLTMLMILSIVPIVIDIVTDS